MTQSYISETKISSSGSNSIIQANYLQETQNSVQIKLINGSKIWLPKNHIDLNYFRDDSIKQDFIIENYILKKIGFKLHLIK
jgi:hypothetical protein